MNEANRMAAQGRRKTAAALGILAILIAGLIAYKRVAAPDVPRLRQSWASSGAEFAETDSLAAARTLDGSVRLYATAKWGDRIDVFDASTGRFIERFGTGGAALGQFHRPNGIAVVKLSHRATSQTAASPSDIIVIVERDGARVQAFDGAPGYRPLGIIGNGILRRPYGAAVSMRSGEPLLFITDTETEASKAVSVFRLVSESNDVRGDLVRQFGDDGAGRIKKAESILIDDVLGLVLLCDEDGGERDVKVYDFDGRFTGRTFGDGVINGDPEGLVIVEAAGGDFILVTDQRDTITIWHAFDRHTYKYIASFTGDPNIANTDGICLFVEPFAGFDRGALFAVNDDADVRAYDLGRIIDFVNGRRNP